MPSRSRSSRFAPLTALVLAATALAQGQSAEPTQGAAAAPAPAQVGPIVSVDFKGGTLGQYVQAIQAAAKSEPVNVFMDEQASSAPVPAIALRQVEVESALAAVTRYRREIMDERARVRFGLDLQRIKPGGDGRPVFVITRGDLDRAPGPVDVYLEAFALRDLVRAPEGVEPGPGTVTTIEAIVSAVDSGLAMVGDAGGRADVKYHPDAGILLVRGTERQTAVVRKLLGELRDDILRARIEGQNARMKQIDLAADVREAEIEMSLRRAEVEGAGRILDERRQLLEAGGIPTAEVAEAEMRMQVAKAQLAKAQNDLERRAQLLKATGTPAPDGPDGAGRVPVPATPEGVRKRIDALEQELSLLRAELERMTKGGGKP